MTYLDDLAQKKLGLAEEQNRQEQLDTVNNSGNKVVEAVQGGTKELTSSIHELLMATLVSKDPKIVEVAKRLVDLVDEINKATSNIKDTNFKPLADGLKSLQVTLKDIPTQIERAHKANDSSTQLKEIAAKIGAQKFNPNITVQAPSVDLSPVSNLITGVEKALKNFKIDIPKLNLDELKEEMQEVKKAINSLSFPVPNYILPFKAVDGKATQVQLDADGKLPITATLTTGDIEIGAVELKNGTDDTRATVTAGNALKVDGSAVTQPVSAASLPLPALAATSTKQSDGSQKSQLVDGSGNVIGATANALDINIKSGNPTSITANAGTNLNTSALALSATQTNGTQKTQIVDVGGEAVTVTSGKLDVNATVTGGTGASAIDDSAFAVASDSGTPTMSLFDDSSPDSVNEGDVGVTRMSANRNAYHTIRDAAGNERGVNVTAGNELNVLASAQPGVDIGDVTLNNPSGSVEDVINVASVLDVIPVGQYNSTLPTLTATRFNNLQLDVKGNLRTVNMDAAGNLRGANVTAANEMNVITTAQPGVDIGDVTINNASGGSAVNIQDGGNSITVDYATTGSGTATGALRVELPTNGTGVVGLNAGTNAIGKLAANSGVDIGDVDVTSIIPGTGATNLGKAEDAAHTTGDTGVMALAVRTDAQAAVATTTGDYIPLITDSVGAQYITPSASVGAIGATIYCKTDLSSTKQAVNASAGNLYGYHIYNPNAVVTYIQLFNVASGSVTVGSTAPTTVIAVPPYGWADATPSMPISFATALTIAATTTSTGSGAPTTALLCNIWYK